MVRKTRFRVSKVQLTSETLSRLTTTERRLLFDMQRAQLVELPEGLILVKEGVRVLKVHSTALSSFPTWIEELVTIVVSKCLNSEVSATHMTGWAEITSYSRCRLHLGIFTTLWRWSCRIFRLQQTQGPACTTRRSGGAETGTQ
jgi:hypothetical protein